MRQNTQRAREVEFHCLYYTSPPPLPFPYLLLLLQAPPSQPLYVSRFLPPFLSTSLHLSRDNFLLPRDPTVAAIDDR